MTGTVAGLCGTALLMESSIAQVLPPSIGTNAPVPIPAPNATSTNTPPQAGIYQTEPYKMLVVVPGSLMDDKMVMRAPAAPPILQHAPEVQLVPRTRR